MIQHREKWFGSDEYIGELFWQLAPSTRYDHQAALECRGQKKDWLPVADCSRWRFERFL